MRHLLLFCAALLLAGTASHANAQAKYFTGGERGGAIGGLLLRDGGVSGTGFQAEGMVSTRVALSLGLSRSTFEELHDVNDVLRFDASSWVVGATFYAGRQNVDGPLTVGVGFGVGGVTTDDDDHNDDDAVTATVVSAAMEVARAVTAPDDPFAVVPSVGAALGLALGETSSEVAPSFGLGLGLGIRFSPSVVLAFEPGVTLVFGGEDLSVGWGGLLSLNIAY